jgi:hypothetical protein
MPPGTLGKSILNQTRAEWTFLWIWSWDCTTPAFDRQKISYLNGLQRKLLIISHNYSPSRHHWTSSFRFPLSANCCHPNQGMTLLFPPTTAPTSQPILRVDLARCHVLGDNSSNQRPAVMICVWRSADMIAGASSSTDKILGPIRPRPFLLNWWEQIALGGLVWDTLNIWYLWMDCYIDKIYEYYRWDRGFINTTKSIEDLV